MGGITDSMDMSLSKLRDSVRNGRPGMLWSMGSERVGHDRATEQQQLQRDGKSLTRKWEGKIPKKVAGWQGRPGPEKCDEPRLRSDLKLTIAKDAHGPE